VSSAISRSRSPPPHRKVNRGIYGRIVQAGMATSAPTTIDSPLTPPSRTDDTIQTRFHVLFMCPKHEEARHHLNDLTLKDIFNFKKGNDSRPRPLPRELHGFQEIQLLPGGRGALQTPIILTRNTRYQNNIFHLWSLITLSTLPGARCTLSLSRMVQTVRARLGII